MCLSQVAGLWAGPVTKCLAGRVDLRMLIDIHLTQFRILTLQVNHLILLELVILQSKKVMNLVLLGLWTCRVKFPLHDFLGNFRILPTRPLSTFWTTGGVDRI